MGKHGSRALLTGILAGIDIRIDGERPWDLHVHNDRFFDRVLGQGALGLGESYMDGWWDVDGLDLFFYRVIKENLEREIRRNWRTELALVRRALFNEQRKSRYLDVGRVHYDLGNDLFQAMLDRRMVYTCGYWRNTSNLEDAQEAKLDLVCRKLGLRSGQKLLDIGCGWGSFAQYAAEKYDVQVIGINNSVEQTKLASERCRGLPIEIRVQDYRDVTGTFDHIVSLGMFEHVGPKNYSTYMRVVDRCLKDEGLFLLHTIGSNKTMKTPDLWVQKYIFPHGVLPVIAEIAHSIEGRFVMEDWQNFGADYDRTLLAWYTNFEESWSKLAENYDERFHRMWSYFLLSFAGAARARSNQVWQIVLSKRGVPGGYRAIR